MDLKGETWKKGKISFASVKQLLASPCTREIWESSYRIELSRSDPKTEFLWEHLYAEPIQVLHKSIWLHVKELFKAHKGPLKFSENC